MASLPGSIFIGLGVVAALRVAVMQLVLSLGGVVILSALIDALAPTFAAQKSQRERPGVN